MKDVLESEKRPCREAAEGVRMEAEETRRPGGAAAMDDSSRVGSGEGDDAWCAGGEAGKAMGELAVSSSSSSSGKRPMSTSSDGR